MGLYRPRKEFKFWLCHDRHEDTRLMEYIAFLKSTRQFARIVRDGLRLMWSLKEGNLTILFELFPHLEKQFNPDATELLAEFRAMMLHSRAVDAPVGQGNTSNKLASVQVALPTFDDDDAPTIVLNRATGSMNGSNFAASLANLMD